VAFRLYRPNEAGQAFFHLVVAEATDQRDAARFARWVERIEQAQHSVRFEAGAAFHPQRIADPAAEFDMRTIIEPSTVADPDHVRAGIVPIARQAVPPGHRLFVREQQRFVARVKAGALQLW